MSRPKTSWIKKIMTEKRIRECTLYPDRSLEQNVFRAFVCIFSWMGGVGIQLIYYTMNITTLDLRTLGVAYFMYALSMMLEFWDVFRITTTYPARAVRILFLLANFVILILSTLFIFIPSDFTMKDGHIPKEFYLIFSTLFLLCVGILIVIIIGLLVAFFEPQKQISDNSNEREEIKEREQQEMRDMYEEAKSLPENY